MHECEQTDKHSALYVTKTHQSFNNKKTTMKEKIILRIINKFSSPYNVIRKFK